LSVTPSGTSATGGGLPATSPGYPCANNRNVTHLPLLPATGPLAAACWTAAHQIPAARLDPRRSWPGAYNL